VVGAPTNGESVTRFRRLSLRHALLAAVALVAALISLISLATGALNGLELQSVDARFRIRGTQGPDKRIAIVALDQRSVKAIGAQLPIPRGLYARVLDRVRAGHPRAIAVDAQFTGASNRRDDDALLAAVARDGPIVLASDASTASGTIPVLAGRSVPPGAVLATAAFPSDSDGVVRHMIYDQAGLTGFAIVAAGRFTGHPVRPRDLPGKQVWIAFRGPPGTYPTYSFVNVRDGRVPSSAFTGRVVLIGITDPEAKDVFPTAVSSEPMSGVELQANALSTVLDGFPLSPASGVVEVLLVLLLAAVPALLSVRLPALYVILAAVATLMAFLVSCQLAFNAGTIVSVPDPILALVLATAGSIGADSFVQRRQLHNLQHFFDLMPSPVSDFFISYRRGPDSFVANALRSGLAEKFGERSVFLDQDAIDAGQEFPARIVEAIIACRAMLVVIGPGWLEAQSADGSRRLDEPEDWVRREIETALHREGIAVVPLLYGGATMPTPQQLPTSIKALANHNAVSLTGGDLPREIDSLVRSMEQGRLREFLASRATTPEASVGPREATVQSES
jgi:CHASE2 domain-containing sensor protein